MKMRTTFAKVTTTNRNMKPGKILGITLIFLMIGSMLGSLPSIANATSPEEITKDYIVSNIDYRNYQSMSLTEIQGFLEAYDSYLATYRAEDIDGVERDAAEIIFNAAHKYRINPQVIIATLQREQSLITLPHEEITEYKLNNAMGCPESTFAEQVDEGAQLYDKYYQDIIKTGTTVYGWGPGITKTTDDGVDITPKNAATACLYQYCPNAGSGWGGSGGGNYLFYRVYTMFGFYEYVDVPPILPETMSATLEPGESITETKTVNIPAKIPRADILLSFDCTGSMSDDIAAAKSRAVDIMNQLDKYISDARYGVVSYSDYPHSYSSYGYSAQYGGSSDYAYRLEQPLTYDRAAVVNAINGLSTEWGADGPQDYTRVMYESYADPSIEWRARVKRILLNFGDNVPHDNDLNEGIPGTSGTWTTGGDPGRDEVMFTSDDLDLQTVINEMVVHGITLLHVHGTGPGFEYWQHWTDWTGGSAYYLSDPSGIVDAIVALVSVEVSYLSTLTLESSLPAWLTSVSPSSYSDLELPTSVSFEIEITVPTDAESGTYMFEIIAMGDGVSYGEQSVEISVLGVEETNLRVFPIAWHHFIMTSPFETLDEAYEYLEETKENGYPSSIEGGWGTATFDLSIENRGDVEAKNVMIEVTVDIGEVKLQEHDWSTGECEINSYDVEPYTIDPIYIGNIPAGESKSTSISVPINYASLIIAKYTTVFCPEVTFTDFSTGFGAWVVTVKVSSDNAAPVTQWRWLWGWDLEWLATFTGKAILSALKCAALKLFEEILQGLFLADLSGCHLHMYDSTGAHVGLNSDGTADYDFPAFLITIDDYEAILVLEPEGDYVLEVEGTETATYNLHLMYVANGDILGEWSCTGSITEEDMYVFTAQVDEDKMTVSPEDTNPPTTELTIGQPRYNGLPEIFVSSATPFTLSAEDGPEGTGVYATSYRIRNATYFSDWTTSTPPMSFWIAKLDDGMYHIDYNSTDNVGNTEPTNTITVILDNTPPATSLTIGEPKYISGTTYVTPDTPFTLEATDTSSGVHYTVYRIYNATYDTGWLPYVVPFNLTGLADGVYTIEFYSTDNVGNTEATSSIQVTLFSWDHIFTDSYGRETTLKINSEHKFFQFITPEKDYGIREATYMRVCRRSIIVYHRDDELRLVTLAVDTKLDFCIAIAWDRQTRTRYFLIDRVGIED